MSKLLILSCSARKDPRPGLLPAIERYTGVFYGAINTIRRDGRWPSEVRLVIVSAKYGFLEEMTPIETYEQKMDRARATELQESVGMALDAFLHQHPCQEIFVVMGELYRLTLVSSVCVHDFQQRGCIGYARARGIAHMRQQLCDWLLRCYEEEQKTLHMP